MLTKELLSKVRKIEIRTRRIVDELTGGAYHSVFKGKGMEFDEVREYIPGDDVRSIDWNVTARTGQPHVKKFVEERELIVFLVVDISGSGDFGSAQQQKNELAAELAAVVAFNAIRNNDQVGLLLFSSRDELHLPPRKGRGHVLRLVRELLAHERQDKGTDIGMALETFMKVSNRKTVMFLISDFIDQGFQRALTIANKKHDLIAIRITDPRERAIPAIGYLSVEDAESGESLTFPTHVARSRRLFAAGSQEAHDAFLDDCRRAGVDLIDIRNGEDYIKPFMQFFRTREKRKRR